jgi:hypothetical protein
MEEGQSWELCLPYVFTNDMAGSLVQWIFCDLLRSHISAQEF